MALLLLRRLTHLTEADPHGHYDETGREPACDFFFLTLSPKEELPLQKIFTERFHALEQSFDELFASPLKDTVDLYLELVVPDRPWSVHRANDELSGPQRWLARYSRNHDLDYIGIFVDQLEAELGTIMDPDDVPLWLDTPNSLFLGNKPAEFLDDPLDRLMRGVITRAKFNLPVT